MSTITAPQRSEHSFPNEIDAPRHPHLEDRVPRTSLPDRLALRLALALLLWSTRPTAAATSPELDRRRRAEHDRELREHAWHLRRACLPLD